MATFKFQNKYVCGAYYNMAQNNFRITVLDILSRIGIKRKDDAADIPELLETIYGFLTGETNDFTKDQMKQKKSLTLRNDQQVKLRLLLFRHFPILKPILASETHKNLQPQKDQLAELMYDEMKCDKKINELIKSKKCKDAKTQQDIETQIKQLKTKKSKIRDEYDDVLFSASHDTDLQNSLKILVTMAWCLNDLRNFYTHYNPYNSPESLKVQYVRQIQISKWLSNVFAASRTIDKERNSITTEEMNFLNEAKKQGKDKKWREDPDYYFAIKGQNLLSESFIDSDSPAYQKYLEELYQKHRKRRLASYRAAMDEALERDNEEEYGFYRMLSEKKDTPEEIAEIKKKICPLSLSDFGVLYFCSTFLPRNYTLLMADHAELMKNSPYNLTDQELEEKKSACETEEEKNKIDRIDTPRNNILREMLCIYRVRLPKGKRLDKKDTKGLLALDILNELRKCPEELYELLSKEGKEFFIDHVKSKDKAAPDIVKRLRFGDRFPYLALRAIDECEVFSRIRFQVRLGSYRFKFYDKTCIDGSTQLRRLQKEINGFGRLQDVEALRQSHWKNLFQKKEYESVQLEDKSAYLDLMQFVNDDKGSAPYITDTRSSYNIHNNRIGLIWNGNECRSLRNIQDGDTQRQGVYLPELKAADGTPKTSGKDIEQLSPLCSLSIYELPALLFYHYLCHTPEVLNSKIDFEKPQQVIINKYNALKAFLNDVCQNPELFVKKDMAEALNQYGLKKSDIPKRIIDCITACQQEEQISNDTNTYLPNLLKLSMDDIKLQAQEKGKERYKDLPTKFLKKIPEEDIIKSGLDILLKPFAMSADQLPIKVLESILHPDEQENVTIETNGPESFNTLFAKSVVSKLEERLKEVAKRRQDFMDSVNRMGSKDNKFAKHGYRDIRHGKLAEYLAKSFIEWQPTMNKGRDKLTGLNYSIMQSFLSSYSGSTNIEDLMSILQKALLIHQSKDIKSPIPHPFLGVVVEKKPRNIEELYYVYIHEEEDYLQNLLEDYNDYINPCEDAEAIPIPERPAFSHPNRKRWKEAASIATLREMAGRYCSPLFLPDGLFVEPIFNLIRTIYSDNQRLMNELSKNNKKGEPASQSASFIIDVYSRIVLRDKAQPYYCGDLALPECSMFGRSYRLFEKLNNQKDQYKAFIKSPHDTAWIMKKLKNREQMKMNIEQYIKTSERRDRDEAEQTVKAKSVRERWSYAQIEEEMNNARRKATWTEKKKQEEREKLEACVKFTQKNEHTIRRYRIQDIVLFQMAKEMLSFILDGDGNNNGTQSFVNQSRHELKLENVCNDNFLGQAIDYEYEYQVGDHTVTITQEGMSLKNYGQFYRFLNDVRLDTLLMLLANVRKVTLTDITSEFAKYDQERPLAFKKLQLFEQLAIESVHSVDLDNPEADGFSFVNPKGEKEPVRNNFAHLLSMLNGLETDKNKLLIDIRNALGHNKYITDSSAMTLDEQLEITQVAVQISEQISLLQQGVHQIDN